MSDHYYIKQALNKPDKEALALLADLLPELRGVFLSDVLVDRDAYDDLVSQVEKQEGEIEWLKDEKEELENQVSDLEDQLAEAKVEVTALEDERTELLDEIAQLKGERQV